MKTPKFAGPLRKKKQTKKTHVTKKEYRRTTASNIDKSLNLLFKGS